MSILYQRRLVNDSGGRASVNTRDEFRHVCVAENVDHEVAA